jgi:hypothetical protein
MTRHVCVYVCMYVCMYVCICTVISLKAGWILIQCRHQMRARAYAHIHTYTCMHSTPHTTNARRTKPGVKWGRAASSFPPPYCKQPGNDEVHYLAKILSFFLSFFIVLFYLAVSRGFYL